MNSPAQPFRREHHREPPVIGGQEGLPLESDLLAFIARGVDAPRDDAEFDDLALRLFAYQFAHNTPYSVRHAARPHAGHRHPLAGCARPVPIAAFKETMLACEPIDGRAAIQLERHHRPSARASTSTPAWPSTISTRRCNCRAHVLPEGPACRLLVLCPPPDQMPNSSLAHWLA